MANDEETLSLILSVKKICEHGHINAKTLMEDLGIQLIITTPEDPFGLGMAGPEIFEWSSKNSTRDIIIESVKFREYEQDGDKHFILALGIYEQAKIDPDIVNKIIDAGVVEAGLMADGRMETRKMSYRGLSVTFIYLRKNESLVEVVITDN